MENNKAFTSKLDFLARSLITGCGVSEAYDTALGGTLPAVLQYEAIWDTGATGTVITAKVANDLGLKPTGIVTSNHAGGSDQVNTYLVNVYLPNKICVVGVQVTEAKLSGNTEMLIGMDIISLGDFSVTNYQGKTCFTFRIPSIKTIDYCEENEKNKRPSFLKPSGSYKGRRK